MRELDGLRDADLRRVADYERANANRKTVLGGDRAQARLSLRRGRRGRRVVRWTGVATTPPTSTRPARGAELELTVDTLAHGGNGVARLDGYVVFVAGALPGDRVRAVVGKSKRAYAEARAVEILEPSPDRIAPRADHPGAPWQVLAYERQLEVKAEQVGDALRRIGKLDGFEQDPIVPAVQQWRYRNKVEYSFGTGPDGALVCGFHAPGRWDEIVPMTDCLLVSERSNAAREQVLAWAPRARASRPGTAATSAACCATSSSARAARRASCRSGSSPRRARSTRTRSRPPSTARACSGRRPPTSARARRAGRRRSSRGSKRLREQLGDLEFLISPEAFFQTNTEMAERALRQRGRARRPARARARLRPLLRHRHDRALARRARARGDRRRDRRARGRRRDRQRAPQRDHQRRASSPATSAWRCASWSSRRASRTSP